jgi:putative transposase
MLAARKPPDSSVGRNRRPPVALAIAIAFNVGMKPTLQIQLMPDHDHAKRLCETVERFNEAADWLAGLAFDRKLSNKIELQRIAYRELRERFSLSAQMAVRCIAQVCEAYKRDKSIKPRFRPHAAMPFDQRMMSFKDVDRASLLTLTGRVSVPMLIGKDQAERIGYPKGQADLVLRGDGRWFLLVTVDVPADTSVPATDFVGVDLGIANIATDSDGNQHSGKDVERARRKHNLQRKRLKRKGTKGAKKKLRRMKGKEARFRRHVNHSISKAIVENAKGTERGIALEDLKGIRERITARGTDARNRLSGWSFAQLYGFVSYKAELAGVAVVTVDPRNTSRTCAACGHCVKSNRKSQAEFACKACGHRAHADRNAALNIRALATRKMAIELDSLLG